MKKRYKNFFVLLAAALLLALCAGCGSGSAADSTAEAGSTEDYYEFSLTMHDAENTVSGQYLQNWADQVYEQTDGHVKITIHFSAVLSAATDVADNVLAGAIDIGWLYTAYFSGQFPLSEVITLPLQGFGDPVVSTEVLWDLYEGYEEVSSEWSGFKLLMLYGNPGMMFASSGSPITSLSDLQGLSIRCPSGPITDVLQAWGANPITMSTPDIYEALEKNNIDGYIFEESGIVTFSLQELTTYITDYPLYDGPFGLVMNWDSWNSLPEEYQEIIDSLSGYDASIAAAEAFGDNAVAARETITDAGVEFVSFSEEALAELQVAADEYAETWVEDVTTDSFDGAAYLAEAKALAEAYAG
ncbi:MAG: TRAP transporter substrate-binding protein [Oscillospiraceae bacterium]|nr:TRAP transporter substrate-binding protein [Oscillospiraceae bacterium]